MYRTIIGLNNDDLHPGYEHFILRPHPGGGLTWARGSYDSIRGRIESSWRLVDGKMEFAVTIPANTSATVFMPAKDASDVQESGKPAKSSVGVQFLRMEDGAAVFLVQSGKYRFLSGIKAGG